MQLRVSPLTTLSFPISQWGCDYAYYPPPRHPWKRNITYAYDTYRQYGSYFGPFHVLATLYHPFI